MHVAGLVNDSSFFLSRFQIESMDRENNKKVSKNNQATSTACLLQAATTTQN